MQTQAPDVSRITDYLFLSSWPKHEHAEHIWELGVRLIVSLPLYWPPKVYRRPPFAFVHCPTIDSPLTPISDLHVAAGRARRSSGDRARRERPDSLQSGVHRSVAMVTCILIAHGYTADDAMALVVEQRPVADPYAPYIQSAQFRKFEQSWQRRHGTS